MPDEVPNETPYGVHNIMSDKMPNNIPCAVMYVKIWPMVCYPLIDKFTLFGDRVEWLQLKDRVRRTGSDR